MNAEAHYLLWNVKGAKTEVKTWQPICIRTKRALEPFYFTIPCYSLEPAIQHILSSATDITMLSTAQDPSVKLCFFLHVNYATLPQLRNTFPWISELTVHTPSEACHFLVNCWEYKGILYALEATFYWAKSINVWFW